MDAHGIAAKAMNAPDEFSIAFRADASIQIGTGHVMRCLTLADALRERGAICTFITRPHSGNLIDVITQRGHHAVALPHLAASGGAVSADPAHAGWLGTDWWIDAQDTLDALGGRRLDWLVVDHYALDYRWEQAVRPYCQNLMVIDDLADRLHDSDLLLDQTFGRDTSDYQCRVPDKCRLLCGSEYALLRPEFANLRSYSRERRMQPALRQLLVNMGGVDKDNMTGQLLHALRFCALPTECRITVVMGPTAPWIDAVRVLANDMPWPTEVMVNVGNMAKLMANSDLAVGAAGATSWERCCLGLPTIMFVLAANQLKVAQELESKGAAVVVSSEQAMEPQLAMLINRLASDPEKLYVMGEAAASVVDGMGAYSVAALLEM